METFSVSLAFCAGNSPVTGEFPTQKPVTRSFDVFFAPTVEQTMETPVIWDAIALIMTSLFASLMEYILPRATYRIYSTTNRNMSGVYIQI